MLWVGSQCVIVVFPDHIHLLFNVWYDYAPKFGKVEGAYCFRLVRFEISYIEFDISKTITAMSFKAGCFA